VSNAYLARCLVPDQPLYGLNHQSADGAPARYTTVETIAAHYLAEIISVRPSGPYRLGGNCFGGLVAFEMAKQLRARGQTVDFLMLLNPAFSDSSHDVQGSLASPGSISARTVGHTANPCALVDRLKTLIARGLAMAIDRVKKPLQRLIYLLSLGSRLPIPESLRSRYILDIYEKANDSYVADTYAGNVLLLFGDDYPQPLRKEWARRCTGGVMIHAVPGDHQQVLEAINVKSWARHLTGHLEALEAAPPHPTKDSSEPAMIPTSGSQSPHRNGLIPALRLPPDAARDSHTFA
jgi:thioesterase domain-containing protein